MDDGWAFMVARCWIVEDLQETHKRELSVNIAIKLNNYKCLLIVRMLLQAGYDILGINKERINSLKLRRIYESKITANYCG